MRKNRVESRRSYGRTALAWVFVLMMFCGMFLWGMPKALAADGTITASGTHDLSEYGNNSTISIFPGTPGIPIFVTLTSAISTTYTDMQIICGEGVTLTIDKVNIVNSADDVCALSFAGSENQLIIAGPSDTITSNLQSGKNAPGIKVEAGTTLEISGTGYATVRGGEGAAGIGAGYGSTITISGGGIWAYGGNNASGIGGSAGGSAGTINISGGRVDATGAGDGAGIGGAAGDGIINISGGYVCAYGNTYGAGIGGAAGSSGGSIAITGGVVFGSGGAEGGAGIGGGYEGDGGTILISGNNISGAPGYTEVCGTGSNGGAGIGGGYGRSAGSITISGGFIYADAVSAPYDVGCGRDSSVEGSLTLSGSSVLFLEHNTCITPETSTHTLKTTPVIPDFDAGADKAYGFYLPAGCGTTAYVYLNESELFDLTYDANGGTGTVPETVTQYKGTTIAAADGSALTKGSVAFSRWNTAGNGSGIDYIKGAPFKITEDTILYAAYGERIDVSSVTLDSHAETMNIGDTLTLTATVLPANASCPEVTWSSSNTSAAAVSQSGSVTAVGAGTATITATADGKSDTCAITVEPIHVASLTLNTDAKTMNSGDTLTLTATVLPADASYPEVTWSSDKESVATVNQSGTVTAVGAGTATITATADGISDTCEITVEGIPVTGVNISGSYNPLTLGSTRALTVTVYPYNATYPDVTWTSSNEAVATVNQSGTVTAVGYGTSTILATADGVSGSYNIRVIPQSTAAYLTSCEIEMDNRFVDSISGDYDTGDVIHDSVINLTMQNIFTGCILTPSCFGSESTYQILYGAQVVSDNAPYTVVMSSPGTQTYTVRVTAQGGATRDYTINIERQAASNQAEPLQIDFEKPDDDFIYFEPNRYEYSAAISYDVAYAEMSVWPMDAGTTYRIYNNGQLLATNRQTSVNFGIGPNKVEVVLTSATGVQKIFTYNVLRTASPSVDLNDIYISSVLSSAYYTDDGYRSEPVNGFDKDITTYNISLPNAAESITLIPFVGGENESLEVKNGSVYISYVEDEGYEVDLDPGLNAVTIKVSHPSASETKTYTLNIMREAGDTANADLCNLFISSTRLAGFDADTITYNYATMGFSSIHPVTADLGATYKVYKDGVQIPADGTVWYSVTGTSVVTVKVTAANGTTTKTYTINLTKPVTAPAKLSTLSVYDSNDDTGYNKVFNVQEGVYSYSASTLYADEKLTLSAAMTNSSGSMSVPSIAIYKGTNKLTENYNTNWASFTVGLDVGLNTFTIAIKENGSTAKTYTLNLTRMGAPADNNANIFDMGFYLSDGDDGENHNDFFSPGVTDYDFDAGSECYEAEFYVTLEDALSKCRFYLNGRLIAISNYFDLSELPLKEGLNTLEAVVTAEDGVTTKTYTISITRADSPVKGLEIVSWPDDTEYIQEQALDLTGLLLVATHESGYYEVVSADDVTASGYDPNTSGNQTVTVSYGDCSDTFLVSVQPLVHVTSVTLSCNSKSMIIGDTLTLAATVLPGNASYPDVTWSSSNTHVAAVSQSGLVAAAGAGTATITATADGVTATCAVSVRATFNITAAANNAAYGNVSGGGSYIKGTSVTLNAAPNTGYRFVRWAENGNTITESPSYSFSATRDAAYTAEFTPLTPVGISCSKTDATLYCGSNGSVTIAASGGDSGTYQYSIDGGVSWQGSNTFSGLPARTYTAAVRDAVYPANSATYAVTVGQPSHVGVVPAKNVSSKPNAGTAVTMVPPAAPKGYTTVSVSYSSSNPSVAAVDSGGNLTFLAGGKATITITVVSQTVDSKGRVKTKTTTVKKTVTVKQPVASISLNMTAATIARTKSVKLAAGIAPATASSKKVKWTSSNPKVASVSSAGGVTGKAGGTAVITCTAQDGSGAAASCTVTVTPVYPTGLKISKAAVSIKPGKTTTLKATVSPKNTDFKTVTWSSSNPAIATVDAKGTVRGVMPGVVTITATTSNGLSAVCTVTIK